MTVSFECSQFGSEFWIFFKLNGKINNDVRGSYGTGCKQYPSKTKAIKAGNRYLSKMEKLGFYPVK